jgi:hypothetical protein
MAWTSKEEVDDDKPRVVVLVVVAVVVVSVVVVILSSRVKSNGLCISMVERGEERKWNVWVLLMYVTNNTTTNILPCLSFFLFVYNFCRAPGENWP